MFASIFLTDYTDIVSCMIEYDKGDEVAGEGGWWVGSWIMIYKGKKTKGGIRDFGFVSQLKFCTLGFIIL